MIERFRRRNPRNSQEQPITKTQQYHFRCWNIWKKWPKVVRPYRMVKRIAAALDGLYSQTLSSSEC